MDQQATLPRTEDLFSVGSRISMGAIVAGALFAFGLYSLLTILGGAVGISISERVNPSTLKETAIGWSVLSIVASLFVGGVITSQFTVGETKTEALFYGVIMWALIFGVLVTMSAAGVRAGFHALLGPSSASEAASAQTWDKLAADAGVPADQIDTWRGKLAAPPGRANQEAQAPLDKEAATRLTWYVFGGTWLSMIAAALGALIGAGPTFKVVTVRPGVRTFG